MPTEQIRNVGSGGSERIGREGGSDPDGMLILRRLRARVRICDAVLCPLSSRTTSAVSAVSAVSAAGDRCGWEPSRPIGKQPQAWDIACLHDGWYSNLLEKFPCCFAWLPSFRSANGGGPPPQFRGSAQAGGLTTLARAGKADSRACGRCDQPQPRQNGQGQGTCDTLRIETGQCLANPSKLNHLGTPFPVCTCPASKPASSPLQARFKHRESV